MKLMLIFLVSNGGDRNHFQTYFYSRKQSFVCSIYFKDRITKYQNNKISKYKSKILSMFYFPLEQLDPDYLSLLFSKFCSGKPDKLTKAGFTCPRVKPKSEVGKTMAMAK